VLTLWLIHLISIRTIEYGLDDFSTGRTLATEGPFDIAISVLMVVALALLGAAIIAAPGAVFYRLFSAKLNKHFRPKISRFVIVPLVVIAFWAAVIWILSMAGCSSTKSLFIGTMKVPLALYEGTSYAVHLKMEEIAVQKGIRGVFESTRNQENVQLKLAIRDGLKVSGIQVELQAPDVIIGGDKKLVQSVSAGLLQYDWALNFNAAGPRILTFVFSLVDTTGKAITVGHFDHEVQVNKLGFLTRVQASILVTLTGILGLISGMVALIKPVAEKLRKKTPSKIVTGFAPGAKSDE
jgi:hypothetical protein